MIRMLATIFRARAAEAEEAVFDANAISLLRQHLRDATQAFDLAKCELARVMAQETGEARRAAEVGENLAALEEDAGKALDTGDDARAEMLAGRIALLEDERAAHQETARICGHEARRIREQVDRAARRIAELKRGLTSASAIDALQRTRGRLGSAGAGGMGAIREAEIALARIRERQQGSEDVSDAMGQLERDLPIGGGTAAEASRRQTDPKEVLARLKRRPPKP